jgi:hypothetical protein
MMIREGQLRVASKELFPHIAGRQSRQYLPRDFLRPLTTIDSHGVNRIVRDGEPLEAGIDRREIAVNLRRRFRACRWRRVITTGL